MNNKNITTMLLIGSATILVGCGSVSPSQGGAEVKVGEKVEEKVVEPTPDEKNDLSTITDIVVATDGVSILKDIVVLLDLADMLSSDGPYTVFAPTNEAFEALLEDLDTTLDELSKDKELLATIVQYHVIEGVFPASEVIKLKNGTSVETVGGQSLTINNQNGVKVNESNVITTDVMASNGVVHLIDAVLLPPTVLEALAEGEGDSKTIVEVAVESGNYPTLVAAVQAAGLVDTLNGDGPFTVFAPTEAAFAKLLSDLDVTASELLADKDLLTTVLTYHVLPETYLAEQVVGLQEVTGFETVQGTEITIDPNGGAPMVNDAKITKTDIITSNGVIHEIDAVLVPAS